MTGALVPSHPSAAQRRRADREFLPAALAILETPPSPVRVALLWTICLFAAFVGAWSYFGRIDIIAVAPGKVHPVGSVKVIEALRTGRVVSIFVRNGQAVKAGQVLVQLDRTDAEADRRAALSALASLEAEIARRSAERDAVQAGRLATLPHVAWPANLPEAIRSREESVLSAELGALASTVATLQAEEMRNEAARKGLQATIQAEEQLIATDSERVRMKTELLQHEAGSKADLINAMETLRYQQMMIAQFENSLAQAQAAEAVVARQIREAYGKFLSDDAEKLDQAQRTVDDLRESVVKDTIALAETTLRSPIDGTVQGLSVTTIGQVLASGSEAMQIVPSGAPLEIEAYLPDSDRAFVRRGDQADVKVASFPFTRYGMLKATVVEVARDAIPDPDALRSEADPTSQQTTAARGAERTLSLVYPVTLKLERTRFDVAGRNIDLSAGMSVNAEIRTGSRRILDYLFSPLAEVGSRAMRER